MHMFRRRSSFPLDRVLAESLEPRVLYSASPIADFDPVELVSDWTAESVHVAQVWTETGSSSADRAAESEHHMSHLLDQTASKDGWELLTEWIAAKSS